MSWGEVAGNVNEPGRNFSSSRMIQLSINHQNVRSIYRSKKINRTFNFKWIFQKTTLSTLVFPIKIKLINKKENNLKIDPQIFFSRSVKLCIIFRLRLLINLKKDPWMIYNFKNISSKVICSKVLDAWLHIWKAEKSWKVLHNPNI